MVQKGGTEGGYRRRVLMGCKKKVQWLGGRYEKTREQIGSITEDGSKGGTRGPSEDDRS